MKQLTIVAPLVNVRKSPSMNSDKNILGTVKEGFSADIIGETVTKDGKKWLAVDTTLIAEFTTPKDVSKGFILDALCSVMELPELGEPTEEPVTEEVIAEGKLDDKAE